jgi:hypothetical protein
VIVALLVFSLLDAWKIVGDYYSDVDELQNESNEVKTAYVHLSEKIHGKVTDGKISFLVDENVRLGEIYRMKTAKIQNPDKSYSGNYYEDFKALMKYFYYPFQASQERIKAYCQIAANAKDNISFYGEFNNSEKMRENRLIEKAYHNRSLTEFYDYSGWEKLIRYGFSNILLLFLLILGITNVFICEKDSNMQGILKSSRYGRRKTLVCKGVASIVFVVLTVVWFSLIDFVMHATLYGLYGGHSPIYLIGFFPGTFLNCTVVDYYVTLLLYRLLGFLIVAIAVLSISAPFRKVIYPCIIETVLVAVLYYFSGYCDAPGWNAWPALFNPVSLINCNPFYESFRTVFVNGIPFMTADVLLLGNIFLVIVGVLVYIAVTFFANHAKIGARHVAV